MPTVFTIKIADDTRGQEAGKSYTMSDADGENLFKAYKAMIDNSRKQQSFMNPSAPAAAPATDKDAVVMMTDTAMNTINTTAHSFAARQAQEQAAAGVKPPTTTDNEIPATPLGGRK